MTGLTEVVLGRVIANGISAGLKEAASTDSSDDDKVLQDAAVELFYEGNLLDCIANGGYSDQIAKLRIESRTNKTLEIEVHGFAAPIEGGLLGPFSTHYQGVERFSVTKNGSCIPLKPNGAIDLDISSFARELAGRQASSADTSRLLFDVPDKDIVVKTPEGQSVPIAPIEYCPPLPTVGDFKGVGAVIQIRMFFDGIEFNKILYGGWAIKDIRDRLQEINPKSNTVFMFLDGFNPAGYSYVATNGAQKGGRWLRDRFACITNNVGRVGASYQGRVISIEAASSVSWCPLFAHALLVTNSPTPLEFSFEI